MSSQTTKKEEVIFAQDNGVNKQWGLGRLFLQLDGTKSRINTKSLIVLVCLGFGVFGFFSMFRTTKVKTEGKSPITQELRLEQSVKDLPQINLDSFRYEGRSKTASFGAGQSNGQNSNQKTSQLIVTRRNVKLSIPPGSMASAKLTSGASNGFVKAELLEALAPFGEVLLPGGTTLVGSAQSSTERLSIHFSKAVLPDSQVISIEAMACDSEDKMPGIKGTNINAQAASLAGAVGLNFAGGVAMGLQSSRLSSDAPPPSLKDGLLNGASVAALEKAKEISEDLNQSHQS